MKITEPIWLFLILGLLTHILMQQSITNGMPITSLFWFVVSLFHLAVFKVLAILKIIHTVRTRKERRP